MRSAFASAIFAAILLSGCGTGPFDVSNSTDRAAMKEQIKLDLTNNDCSDALVLSTQLYQSSYSDNDTRMLYASANACNVGIQLFDLLNDITNASYNTPDAIFRLFVKLFPSTSADSRMTSAWFAQDALQAMLTPGGVVAPVDQINFTSVNPASDLASDRTLDSSSYLMFVSMGVIGTTLNRYGYTSSQSAAALSYSQGQDLPWITQAEVQADTTGSACALVSGFYNLFDGIAQVVGYVSGSTNAQLSLITTTLQSGFNLVGTTECTMVGGFTSAQCAAAAARIRYRGACTEQAAAASFVSGVIQGINAGWM